MQCIAFLRDKLKPLHLSKEEMILEKIFAVTEKLTEIANAVY